MNLNDIIEYRNEGYDLTFGSWGILGWILYVFLVGVGSIALGFYIINKLNRPLGFYILYKLGLKRGIKDGTRRNL